MVEQQQRTVVLVGAEQPVEPEQHRQERRDPDDPRRQLRQQGAIGADGEGHHRRPPSRRTAPERQHIAAEPGRQPEIAGEDSEDRAHGGDQRPCRCARDVVVRRGDHRARRSRSARRPVRPAGRAPASPARPAGSSRSQILRSITSSRASASRRVCPATQMSGIDGAEPAQTHPLQRRPRRAIPVGPFTLRQKCEVFGQRQPRLHRRANGPGSGGRGASIRSRSTASAGSNSPASGQQQVDLPGPVRARAAAGHRRRPASG